MWSWLVPASRVWCARKFMTGPPAHDIYPSFCCCAVRAAQVPRRDRAEGQGPGAGLGRRRHVVLECLPGRPLRRPRPRVQVSRGHRAIPTQLDFQPCGKRDCLSCSYGFDKDLEREYADNWTGMMASQPELMAYAEHVAQRFDLVRDITFDTKVVGCDWDEAESSWTVATDTGTTVTGKFVVTCIGCLSEPNVPDIEGRDDFGGETIFTSRFPKDGVENRFEGKRVAVIGTGSSGIQSIPKIAEQSGHLTVFQRTPQYLLRGTYVT